MSNNLVTEIEFTDTLSRAMQPVFASGFSLKFGFNLWTLLLFSVSRVVPNILVSIMISMALVLMLSYLLGMLTPGFLVQKLSLIIGSASRDSVIGGLFRILDSSLSRTWKVPASPVGCNRIYEP